MKALNVHVSLNPDDLTTFYCNLCSEGYHLCLNLIVVNRQYLIGAGLQIQGISPLSSKWEHGSLQADVKPEEMIPKADRRRLVSRQLGQGS